MQDPETYLNQLGVTLTCAVDPARPAVIDRDHRFTVGYETFFVSDAGARRQLESDPELWGWITDPVSKERFRPERRSPRAEFAGRLYLFSDAANQSAFQQDPSRYAYPEYTMLPMED